MELLYDSAIPFLSVYPGEIKTQIQKDTCAPVFMEAT